MPLYDSIQLSWLMSNMWSHGDFVIHSHCFRICVDHFCLFLVKIMGFHESSLFTFQAGNYCSKHAVLVKVVVCTVSRLFDGLTQCSDFSNMYP